MRSSQRGSVVVIGAGGHAKVVISTLQAAGYMVRAAYDDAPDRWGTRILGVPVVGPLSQLSGQAERAVIAIGNNRVRQTLCGQLANLAWETVVHPRAYVHESVQLGPGSVVLAGAVIQPETRLGSHVIINTGATIDHDCVVGDYAHTAPGVHVAGGAELEEGAFLGVGTAVIPGRRVGAWATVGAGGVVVHDIPPHVVAVGVPARPR